MKFKFPNRIIFVYFFIIFITIIFIFKLFLLQIVHKNTFIEKADRQYMTPSTSIFERGSIFFSKKDDELSSAAMQITTYKIAIKPNKIKDIETLYNTLSSVIEIDHEIFLSKANKKNDPYEDIKDNLSKSDADKISMLKLSEVEISKEKRRYYPNIYLASHSLGFVAYNNNSLEGRYGLEKKYNDILSVNKDNPYINFFAEVFSDLNKSIFSSKNKKGDIITSIEPNVQIFLEKELLKVKEKYNVDSVGGIIMNPIDGSIYAISSKPDFDLNNFSKVKNVSVYRNPMVENVLEFGSIVKPLVMAGGLDAKVITASSSYNDTGSVIVEKKVIYNFDKKGRGPNTNMQEVLGQSLNTGMVYVYKHLGKERMRDYMLSFGIKDKTGIDLPNETSGLVSNLYSPRELEYANASFGQGIALTPVEMIRALASLSNGGYLVTPHLVKKIKYNDGSTEDIVYEKKQTKISKEASEEITRMLVGVMDKSLKGGLAKFDNHSVAVKTGTAQVAKEDGGGYYEDRHTHSFFGYFPAYDPSFIVLLYAVNQKGVPYASQTWADPFISITKFLINYYEIPPDR